MGCLRFVSIVTLVYDHILNVSLKCSFASEPCFVCVVLQKITVAVATAEEEVCVLIMPDCMYSSSI